MRQHLHPGGGVSSPEVEVVPATADGVRARNRELDAQLLALADGLREVAPAPDRAGRARVGAAGEPARGPAPDAEEAWSAFQVVAHVAEMSRFFAAHLEAWKADPATVIGRTVEHEERRAAVARARVNLMGASALADDLRASLARLGDALSVLSDADIGAMTSNVKYGTEPLSAFLARYVLGHKAGHVTQLRELLEARP
jgi:hypothetical protein